VCAQGSLENDRACEIREKKGHSRIDSSQVELSRVLGSMPGEKAPEREIPGERRPINHVI